MTLNMTVIGSDIVCQVSDRRFVNSATGEVSDDNANKALVLSCEDALLSITFSGVGTFTRGTDGAEEKISWWLGTKMIEDGIPEMPAERAVEYIATAAEKLFNRFPRTKKPFHSFAIAGWSYTSPAPEPRGWVITNARDPGAGMTSAVGHRFQIKELHRPRKGALLFVTGLVPAFGRKVRRRVMARLKGEADVDVTEDALVQGIRDAASNPRWSWGIGQACTAITLLASREARASYYAEGGSQHSYGPVAVWNSGSKNILVGEIDVVPGAGYRVAYGGPPSGFTLAVGQSEELAGPRLPIGPDNELVLDLKLRVSNAKFSPPGQPGETGTFMSILKD